MLIGVKGMSEKKGSRSLGSRLVQGDRMHRSQKCVSFAQNGVLCQRSGTAKGHACHKTF